MAALMDSYQPESHLPFARRYPDSPLGYQPVRELDEGDLVRSKPRGIMNYRPLNSDDGKDESFERYDSTCTVETTPGYSEHRGHGDEQSETHKSASKILEQTQRVIDSSRIPPNGGLPGFNSVSSQLGETLEDEETIKFDLGKMYGAGGSIEPIQEDENDSDKALEDSTTALLKQYTTKRNGHPTSIHLGPSGEIVGSGWLTDILMMGHKKYSVSLEEDSISWRVLSQKESKANSLYLSDIYAVVQGTSSQTPVHTPLTPHSFDPHTHPLASSSSTSSTTVRSNVTNQRKLGRKLSSSFSSSSSFTLHALKSQPGSVGQLVKITFRCPTRETAQTWVEQIMQQMQNFGNRPRKLYIVINPASGGGGSSSEKTWQKVHQMFQIANIHTDVLTTQHRFHAREQIQSLELTQYDGIVAVGGDGLFNELLNGLLIQTQNQSGVNLRRSRFVPVTPSIRLGVIPTGFSNSICRSVVGCNSPMVAAAQIMLGCSSPVDVCSVSQNNTLLLFSAGPMSYGFWSDTATFSHDFTWIGSRRFDLATLRTLLSHRHFEAEIQFVPVEDPEEIVRNKERCFNRCQKCSNFESNIDSSSGASEKGASVMAAYSEIDRVDKSKWKTITGQFSSVVSCLNTCCGVQAPHGISPYGHIGNGCTDLIMLTRCSTFDHAKWLLKQRKKSSCQFDHPYVHIRRVKEFRFREILPPLEGYGGDSSRSSADPDDVEVGSIDNLVGEPDDDEVTNSRAGTRSQSHGDARYRSSVLHTSQWNIDGDELPRADIEVRVHRHLVSMFARGIEPLYMEDISTDSITVDNQTDQQDLIH